MEIKQIKSIEDFSSLIKEIRENKHLTMQKCADFNNESRQSWNNLERFDSNPTLTRMLKTTDILDIGIFVVY